VAIYYGMYARAGSELRWLSAPLLLLQGEDDENDFVANAKRVQELARRDENLGRKYSTRVPGTSSICLSRAAEQRETPGSGRSN